MDSAQRLQDWFGKSSGLVQISRISKRAVLCFGFVFYIQGILQTNINFTQNYISRTVVGLLHSQIKP